MTPGKEKIKALKPHDFIKNQQKAAEEKLQAKKTLDIENKSKAKALAAVDRSELPDVSNFIEALLQVLTKSRDRKFIDDKIHELDFYKKLASKMIAQGCDASSFKTAQSFLQAIDQAHVLLEGLWKFYVIKN
jgi:hypothetical protein